MQGIFINGRRPKSKKEVKDTVRDDPASVTIESTSVFGNEYGGAVSAMPEGNKIHFVGPDPYEKRNFYGTIRRSGDKITVI